jgi:hypothetical protein
MSNVKKNDKNMKKISQFDKMHFLRKHQIDISCFMIRFLVMITINKKIMVNLVVPEKVQL